MGRMHWTAYLWPGLPQLWDRGSGPGLVLALGSAAMLNAALLGTLVWSEWLPPGVRSALWLGVAVVWSGSALVSQGLKRPAGGGEDSSSTTEPLFVQALGLYLQGDWFEAERTLVTLLRRNPRDVDARFLIATLLRHTARLDEAARQLDQVERLEASRKWELEISRERALIAQARAECAGQDQGGQAQSTPEGPPQTAGVGQAA